MDSSACKDVNEFANKLDTVADLIRRLQKMPQNAHVVDFLKDSIRGVRIDKKQHNGYVEDVVVVY